MNQRRGLAQIFDPTRRKSIIAAKRGMAMARIPFSRSVTRIGPCQPLVQTRSLPALMSVPLFVGAMPFTLEIGEALLFHPGFSAKQEIARGALHVDYMGVIGLIGPGISEPKQMLVSDQI